MCIIGISQITKDITKNPYTKTLTIQLYLRHNFRFQLYTSVPHYRLGTYIYFNNAISKI